MEMLNITKQIIDKLEKEGKVSKVPIEEIMKINKHMEEVRREFLIKQFESEQLASKIILFG